MTTSLRSIGRVSQGARPLSTLSLLLVQKLPLIICIAAFLFVTAVIFTL
ncbi:hypothetical protein [Allorhizobium undicola]|nr:hypothetical protein [Allorhizobium undicola]